MAQVRHLDFDMAVYGPDGRNFMKYIEGRNATCTYAKPPNVVTRTGKYGKSDISIIVNYYRTQYQLSEAAGTVMANGLYYRPQVVLLCYQYYSTRDWEKLPAYFREIEEVFGQGCCKKDMHVCLVPHHPEGDEKWPKVCYDEDDFGLKHKHSRIDIKPSPASVALVIEQMVGGTFPPPVCLVS